MTCKQFGKLILSSLLKIIGVMWLINNASNSTIIDKLFAVIIAIILFSIGEYIILKKLKPKHLKQDTLPNNQGEKDEQ